MCGIFACCISGLVVVSRFGKYIKVTKCTYERVYYDSEFGQLTDSSLKWEGLQNNSLKLSNLKKTVNNIKNISESENDKNSNSNEISPPISSSDSSSEIQINFNDLEKKKQMEDLKGNCRDISEKYCEGKNLYIFENNKCSDNIFFDYNKPDNPNSIVGQFEKELNNILNLAINQYEEIEESVEIISDFGDIFYEELNTSVNKFNLISNDLKNYKEGYLDKVEYYSKIAQGWGYILVIIYLSLLCFFSVCGCILLLVYSYLTNQGNLGTLMHIIWNAMHFFSISFFIYGAAFGMLYNGLRDLIAYNKFLFGENLKSNTTYLLPKNESKNFLDFCLTEENAEFTDVVDDLLSETLNSVYTNYVNMNESLKKVNITKTDTILKGFKKGYIVCCNDGGLRNLEEWDSSNEDEESSELEESGETTSDSSFTQYIPLSIDLINELVNLINKVLEKFKDLLVLDFGDTSTRRLSLLTSFDCGFLKNDLKLIYNSLYDLSVESRILCVLSCCIGFFGEILVHFYLLSMYHYDTGIFKEGSLSMKRIRNQQNEIEKSVDVNSRNEFMNKMNPSHMKRANKRLDEKYH